MRGLIERVRFMTERAIASKTIKIASSIKPYYERVAYKALCSTAYFGLLTKKN